MCIHQFKTDGRMCCVANMSTEIHRGLLKVDWNWSGIERTISWLHPVESQTMAIQSIWLLFIGQYAISFSAFIAQVVSIVYSSLSVPTFSTAFLMHNTYYSCHYHTFYVAHPYRAAMFSLLASITVFSSTPFREATWAATRSTWPGRLKLWR